MGKTVTTYLIDGDPKGTQYAFISNKICQMFVVPRSNLSYLNTQEKLQKPAFYILLGEDESTKPQAYIGETENFKERVKDHDSKKAFWQKALIFVSKDADITVAFRVELPLPAASTPVSAARPRRPAGARQWDLLLVEDDPTVAEVIASLLRAQGHSVAHAPHGLAALADVGNALKTQPKLLPPHYTGFVSRDNTFYKPIRDAGLATGKLSAR